MLNFDAHSHRPLREIVYEELKMQILTGKITPGTRMMEVELAESMGVSRTPIREAIKKLETEGYVERTKNQEDNRSFFLQLTEKGKQYTKATSEISGKLVSKAYENFSEEEKNAAYALLSRICDNFMIG
jgi:DNA-binding GntR family transcriptional regulator